MFHTGKSSGEMDSIYRDDGKPMQCFQTVYPGVHSIEPQSISLLMNGRLQQLHRCEFCHVSCIRIRRRTLEYAENTETKFSEYFFVEHTAEHMSYISSCALMLKGIRKVKVSDQSQRL